MASPFATLPPELLLHVLSLASSHRPTAVALSLVSHWVHNHVERNLYHTVSLSSSRSLVAFIASPNSKPHAFAHNLVKRLSITALGPISNIDEVLKKCTGVTSLVCGFSGPSYLHCARSLKQPVAPPEITTFRLPIAPHEQFLIALACRDGIDMSIISPSVTHLRIQLTPATTSESVARLRELSYLTHLAITYRHGLHGNANSVKEMIKPVLEEGRLKILVIYVTGAGSEAHRKEIEEWRTDSALEVIDSTSASSTQKCLGCRPHTLIIAKRATAAVLPQWEQGVNIWDVSSI
ncbi:uncharacterized protein BJ212DRAFT_1356179 [Suillus subaureus]|uniref:F-box domain-containing protein n=1 Tax=Suillus subaureus TaxID=48587 RepID=A0A9P7EB15_9AGAM|nr:uncharacterized protein BJ212DRAFT_1356179 [Suillus subaureus]KAG1816056.1 hypothetical protein BJ212DRAFT_1356179 [Suillus subaureus]